MSKTTDSGRKRTNVATIELARLAAAAHLLPACGWTPLAAAIFLVEVAHVVGSAARDALNPVVAIDAVAVALLALGVDPIGAPALVGVDLLRVHACAGLVNVVKVADAGVDFVVGNPDTIAVFGPAEDGGGTRDEGKSGGEEGGELHFGGWEGWMVPGRNDVFGGEKCVSDVVDGEDSGFGDVTESVMMMLGVEAGEVKRFLYQSW